MANSPQVVAIIPARSGSKGIPGKNLRPLGGMPMLAHTIAQARRSRHVKRVVVSTDGREIASVASRYGADVIRRPADISGDAASSESALVHALDSMRAADGYEPDLVVFLQATSPLRADGDIDSAIETLAAEQADSLFSACALQGFVWRMVDGEPHSLTYDHRSRPRRQDHPEDLIENGSIYVFKPWVIRQHNNRLGGRIAVYRMSLVNSFQIDEPSDLELIERLSAGGRRSQDWAGIEAVRLLVMDFDGVMTDNRVLLDENGVESVWCSRADGMGIERLRAAGVSMAVLSKEKNPVVAVRCTKLGVACIQGRDEKLQVFRELVENSGLRPDQVAYLGNDVNDLECMRFAGLAIAVADAFPAVRDAARFVTTRPGGDGAVREVADAILERLEMRNDSSRKESEEYGT